MFKGIFENIQQFENLNFIIAECFYGRRSFESEISFGLFWALRQGEDSQSFLNKHRLWLIFITSIDN